MAGLYTYCDPVNKNGGKRNEQTNNDIHGPVGGPEL